MSVDRKRELEKLVGEVEEELERFEALGREATGVPLDGQKNLERATRVLERLAQAEERLQQRAGRLSEAMGRLRDRREQVVATVADWSERWKERSAAWVALRDRYVALAGDTATAHETLAAGVGDAAVVGDVETRLRGLAEAGATLTEEARAHGFKDLERDAASLHAQLADAADKLGTVRARMT